MSIVVTMRDPLQLVSFVHRGCKGELVGQDWQKMNEILVELTPESLSATLEKCYDNQRNQIAQKGKLKSVIKKSEEPTYLKISKHLLDFKFPEGRLCPLDTELEDEVVITNIGPGKAKFKVSPIPPAPSHILTVTPKDGVLKKKQSLTIQFKLRVRTTTKLRKVVTIELEGGCKYFMVVSVDSEKSVFGVGVDELECVEDHGVRVPQVLVTLRDYLYAHNGLQQEGVFRVQGDEKELQLVKNQLNKGTFTECKDVNCIASLIKLWFRELPSPILNIPIESLRTLESEDECVAIYSDLPEPNRALMTWLLDVLADASMYSSNKMTPRNFAICVAPNLFTSTGTNPADSLFISGKVVHFVSQILNYRLRLKIQRERPASEP
eukprot:Phypoly_transcript_07898.p1 GENE.Phypoly_transcript_07898~~Phypoly_transcript_07898.p1  ORF type:complete len:379 (+),score=41.02 Phypoly_transcript_07898:156-1292(+)